MVGGSQWGMIWFYSFSYVLVWFLLFVCLHQICIVGYLHLSFTISSSQILDIKVEPVFGILWMRVVLDCVMIVYSNFNSDNGQISLIFTWIYLSHSLHFGAPVGSRFRLSTVNISNEISNFAAILGICLRQALDGATSEWRAAVFGALGNGLLYWWRYWFFGFPLVPLSFHIPGNDSMLA